MSSDGSDDFYQAWMLVGPVCLGTAFVGYTAIVGAIIVKKRLYGNSYNISPREIRLLVQAFFLLVPPALLILIGSLIQGLEEQNWAYAIFNITAALNPANTLVNYVLFNP
ncbi:hypothetical protein L596_017933 [Steinernema carpocapsae]|uniref:G-protein coupled receptors family 1 profile domain-containing protein n=1 Tax=Steinernema carpocapsae TaxID=34508 RepID=A0A4U5N3F8_STECR|nr:hypothetical protein L596_017933 [Steinernema carpocapsae]